MSRRRADNFDLVILGGGTAAVAAATQADEMGATVALINSGLPLGGTRVNMGRTGPVAVTQPDRWSHEEGTRHRRSVA